MVSRYTKGGKLKSKFKSRRGIALLRRNRDVPTRTLNNSPPPNSPSDVETIASETSSSSSNLTQGKNFPPTNNENYSNIDNNATHESLTTPNTYQTLGFTPHDHTYTSHSRAQQEKNFPSRSNEHDSNIDSNPTHEPLKTPNTCQTLGFTPHDHTYTSHSGAQQEPFEIMLTQPGETECNNSAGGSRVIEIDFYEEQMMKINSHNSNFNCNFSNMMLISEKRFGIASIRYYECGMCKTVETVYSHRYMVKKKAEKCKEMNINEAAVAGALLAGVGQTVLDKILSSMNIPTMSPSTYSKYQSNVGKNLHDLALEDMRKAAARAAEIARAKGNVAPDGVPLLTVICDGSWCKRSYRSTYNSTGGCGAIIEVETQQIIYIGVKNKFCMLCTRAKNLNKRPKVHVCFKNWPEGRSAASMETAAIVEGFLLSEELYGVRFHKFIADGDSSVYKAILDANPYENLVVQKIECKNHLLRNFSSHLQAECSSSSDRNREVCKLKKKVEEKIVKLRSSIDKAIEHRAKDGVTSQAAAALAKDIINAPSHIFGEHLHCAELQYFCDGQAKDGEENLVPQLQAVGLYTKILERCNILADHSTSLLHRVTTNIVESFNSIIAMRIGGKRVNCTGRGGYDARVSSSVSSLAHGQTYRFLHKKMTNKSPGVYSKSVENRLLKKRIYQRNLKCKRKLHFNGKKQNSVKETGKDDYGPKAPKPDKTPIEYEQAKERRLAWLKEKVKDRKKLEEETRNQRDSHLWMETRRYLITASNMGRICKLRLSTSTSNTVRDILYASIDSPAMKWGRDKERLAKERLRTDQNLDTLDCGLHVHRDHPFIGASPDGVIGDNALLEVKCPYSARRMTIQQAIDRKKITCLKEDNSIKSMKENHNYYYQIQGQLEVTDREWCAFMIWTTVEYILIWVKRDRSFWSTKMLPKLLTFYDKCLLPEIVDPRNTRSMPLRDVNVEGNAVVKKVKVTKKTSDENECEENVDDPDSI